MQTTNISENTTQSDPNLDNMYMLLDPHLRPGTPDNNNQYSMEIFEKHKQLAQDYFKVLVCFNKQFDRRDRLVLVKRRREESKVVTPLGAPLCIRIEQRRCCSRIVKAEVAQFQHTRRSNKEVIVKQINQVLLLFLTLCILISAVSVITPRNKK